MYAVNREWILKDGVIFDSILNCKDQPPVELEYMEELLNDLCSPSIKKVMLKMKDELRYIPLAEWLENLREKREEVHIQDSASVEAFLAHFKQHHHEDSIDISDIRVRSPKIKGILDSIKNPPNNM